MSIKIINCLRSQKSNTELSISSTPNFCAPQDQFTKFAQNSRKASWRDPKFLARLNTLFMS